MGSSETDHAAARATEHLAEPFAVECAHGEAVAVMVLDHPKTLHHTIWATRGRVGDHGRVLLSGTQGVEDLLLGHDQRIGVQVIHIYLPPLVTLGQK
jgi:hypothetical protein